MDYEELLKRAKQNLPAAQQEGRFEVPIAMVNIVKRTTIIKNFADIAKTVRREPGHIAKFLFKELALPGSISTGTLVLQGKVAASTVNQRLQDYVKEYVLCKECGKPDTHLSKAGTITTIKCEACGARRTFKGVK
jgi:translation initiation factor 2 subunit 2